MCTKTCMFTFHDFSVNDIAGLSHGGRPLHQLHEGCTIWLQKLHFEPNRSPEHVMLKLQVAPPCKQTLQHLAARSQASLAKALDSQASSVYLMAPKGSPITDPSEMIQGNQCKQQAQSSQPPQRILSLCQSLDGRKRPGLTRRRHAKH